MKSLLMVIFSTIQNHLTFSKYAYAGEILSTINKYQNAKDEAALFSKFSLI
jgi:hypothetical protein